MFMGVISDREVPESPVEQGAGEKVKYTFDFATWGIGSPVNPTLTIWDVTGDVREDVTATALPSGAPSVAGSVVTTPLVQSLVAGHQYRMDCAVEDSDGQEKDAYCIINATA